MSSFWRNFHHWLHWKLSFWQLPVQPVMIISSKWRHFRFSAFLITRRYRPQLMDIFIFITYTYKHTHTYILINICCRFDDMNIMRIRQVAMVIIIRFSQLPTRCPRLPTRCLRLPTRCLRLPTRCVRQVHDFPDHAHDLAWSDLVPHRGWNHDQHDKVLLFKTVLLASRSLPILSRPRGFPRW